MSWEVLTICSIIFKGRIRLGLTMEKIVELARFETFMLNINPVHRTPKNLILKSFTLAEIGVTGTLPRTMRTALRNIPSQVL